ncbi:MAG: sugar ABC transporter ATP-binding protein [Clostridia bacterium]
MGKEHYVLEMRQITKRFPGVLALDRVDLKVREGEVHCLVGENGAGKSTLMKILSGAYKKDSGEMLFLGRKVELTGPRHALDLGIRQVYQDRKLVGSMSVAENIFLGKTPVLPRLRGFVNWGRLNQETRALLAEVGLDVDPRAKVEDLSPAKQQMVEVARACSGGGRLIVLDEPSAALTNEELDALFRTTASLKEKGVSLIYITHRLEEVFQIGDRATVLRDGKLAGEVNCKDVTKADIIRMMVGREVGLSYPERIGTPGETILEVRNLSVSNRVDDANLTLRKGEILGIFGLVGAGRTELVRAIAGADRRQSGTILIEGKKADIRVPGDAIRAGIGLVTENRKETGLILKHSVSKNVVLPILRALSAGGFVKEDQEKGILDTHIRNLSIATPSRHTLAESLSGGNQQKVVLAKWLTANPRILILDEPTIGIDVGAKEEVYKIMRSLAARGVGIIMVSSEMPEIIGMSDRVLVMREGRIVKELSSDNLTQETIMSWAIGGE